MIKMFVAIFLFHLDEYTHWKSHTTDNKFSWIKWLLKFVSVSTFWTKFLHNFVTNIEMKKQKTVGFYLKPIFHQYFINIKIQAYY